MDNNMDSISRPLQGPIRTEATPVFDVTAEEEIQAGVAPSVVAPRGVRLAPTAVPVPIAAPPLDQPDVKTLADRYTAAIEARGRAELRIDAAKSALQSATEDAERLAKEAEVVRQELLLLLAK